MKTKRIAAALLAALMLIPMIMTGCVRPEPAQPDPTEPAPTEDTRPAVREPGKIEVTKVDYPKNPYTVSDPNKIDASMEAAWSEAMRIRRAASVSAAKMDSFTKALADALTAEDGKNTVFSPANIYIALAMLAETCDGETRTEILSALGAADMPSLRRGVSSLITAETVDDGITTSLLANSLWLNNRIGFNTDTLERIAENYSASSYWGDMADPAFNEELRNWLNDNTGGLLKDAANGVRLDPLTVLAICSTIYFKAPWSDRFHGAATDKQIFHTKDGDITVDFMHKTVSGCDYFKGSGFTAAADKVVGGKVWYLLPDEGVSVEDMLKNGGLDYVLGDHTADESRRVAFSVPKIDVSSDLDLIPALRKMGVNSCFDCSVADFSPLTDESEGLEVSEVKHAARVKTDEDGIEAAAYTVIMIAYGAAPSPMDYVEFTLDRPFAFVVTGETGAPLFIGVVNTPNN